MAALSEFQRLHTLWGIDKLNVPRSDIPAITHPAARNGWIRQRLLATKSSGPLV
jgi:hypothetical protein